MRTNFFSPSGVSAVSAIFCPGYRIRQSSTLTANVMGQIVMDAVLQLRFGFLAALLDHETHRHCSRPWICIIIFGERSTGTYVFVARWSCLQPLPGVSAVLFTSNRRLMGEFVNFVVEAFRLMVVGIIVGLNLWLLLHAFN